VLPSASEVPAARANNPPPRCVDAGNLFGLICFNTECRPSGRLELEEESLSSRWG
jgi:hypothetical protein